MRTHIETPRSIRPPPPPSTINKLNKTPKYIYTHFCFITFLFNLYLEEVTEGQGLDGGELGSVSGLDEISRLGEGGGALEVDLDSGLGGLGLDLLVLDNPAQDLLLALGLPDVLDADVNALLDDPAVDVLVDTDSDGGLGEVEDDSGAAVVVLVGHTLVDGGVGEDVDVVSDLDGHQVLGELNGAVLAELLGEHVPGTGAGSE